MTDGFKDHFSGHAADYGQYRPQYPDALFAYLASVAPGTGMAWDCATGTGQAAQGLADYFDTVIATDASAQQIESSRSLARIQYRVAPAEDSGMPAGSIDLVTVAQALHWFDLDRFYAEAQRVLKPGGVLAAWTYNLLHVTPWIDAQVSHLYGPLLDRFWPEERRLVEQGYKSMPFPFLEIPHPSFEMSTDWNLPQLMGYLGTWSAVQKYRREIGQDPLAIIASAISEAWGDSQATRKINWPLSMRLGRKA